MPGTSVAACREVIDRTYQSSKVLLFGVASSSGDGHAPTLQGEMLHLRQDSSLMGSQQAFVADVLSHLSSICETVTGWMLMSVAYHALELLS